jgi:hypothetical protein
LPVKRDRNLLFAETVRGSRGWLSLRGGTHEPLITGGFRGVKASSKMNDAKRGEEVATGRNSMFFVLLF